MYQRGVPTWLLAIWSSLSRVLALVDCHVPITVIVWQGATLNDYPYEMDRLEEESLWN